MKNRMLFAAGLVASVAVVLTAGCASVLRPLTPTQISNIACPPIQGAIKQFQAIDALMVDDPHARKADAELAKARPIVDATCKAGATVTTDNIADFAQTVLPALGTIAGTLPLPAPTLKSILDGLAVAETAVGVAGVVARNVSAAQVAVASGTATPQ